MRAIPIMSTRCASAWSVLALLGVAACGLAPPSSSNGGGGRSGSSLSKSSGGGASSSPSSGGQTAETSSAGAGQSSASRTGGGGFSSESSSGGSTRNDSGTGGAGGTGADTGARDAGVQPDLPPDAPALTRGPTPKQPGVDFPFPQNRELNRCLYPKAYRNEDVQAAYEQWKRDTVTSDGARNFRRVKRPNEPGTLEPNSTVSEGIAYGMLIAVYMNDQSLFDDLWQYEQQFRDDKTGLMHWYIKADGSGPAEMGPATDADEDMAYALVMADRQWGTSQKLGKYIDIAKDTITKIWNNEIFDYKYVRSWPGADSSTINLSYFAPSYYKLFAKIDTKNATNWTNTVDAMYTVLNASLNAGNGNADNGLPPAWCDASGKPNGGAFGPGKPASPTNYQYDSCRIPFRIGLDWCMNGEQRARDYLAKTTKFFSNIGASKIVDGYELNGTPKPQYQTGGNASVQSAAFVGPAGVGAMSSSSSQSFVDDSYAVLATRTALVGGTYYDDSWMVLSLLMMTANFLDYTTYTP